MLKIGLTAVSTAACCFAIAAATGFGAAPVALQMKLHQIISLRSDNFHCEALTTTQVACGANALADSTQVYFATHALAVVKFDKTGKNGTILFKTNR
jgi:hypothetical protein